MKTFKKIIFFVAVIVFIANASCKKYPDGPLISLHTKQQRFCGTWDVSNFSINGNDSTDYLKSQPFYGTYKFDTPQGDKDGFVEYNTKSNNCHGSGSWYFTNNKKSVNISCGKDYGNLLIVSIGPYGPGAGSNIVWDIMRLEEKELWLQTTFNGKQYFVKFNSI